MGIVIALAGNKCDLASKRKVESSEASEYAKDNGLYFLETSAKTALNVEDLFKAIAKKLPKDPYREQPDKVDIDPGQETTPSGGAAVSRERSGLRSFIGYVYVCISSVGLRCALQRMWGKQIRHLNRQTTLKNLQKKNQAPDEVRYEGPRRVE